MILQWPCPFCDDPVAPSLQCINIHLKRNHSLSLRTFQKSYGDPLKQTVPFVDINWESEPQDGMLRCKICQERMTFEKKCLESHLRYIHGSSYGQYVKMMNGLCEINTFSTKISSCDKDDDEGAYLKERRGEAPRGSIDCTLSIRPKDHCSSTNDYKSTRWQTIPNLSLIHI